MEIIVRAEFAGRYAEGELNSRVGSIVKKSRAGIKE